LEAFGSTILAERSYEGRLALYRWLIINNTTNDSVALSFCHEGFSSYGSPTHFELVEIEEKTAVKLLIAFIRNKSKMLVYRRLLMYTLFMLK